MTACFRFFGGLNFQKRMVRRLLSRIDLGRTGEERSGSQYKRVKIHGEVLLGFLFICIVQFSHADTDPSDGKDSIFFLSSPISLSRVSRVMLWVDNYPSLPLLLCVMLEVSHLNQNYITLRLWFLLVTNFGSILPLAGPMCNGY